MANLDLKQAVESNFDCEAEWLRTEHVREESQGRVAFDGDVEIFVIKGHPETDIAYAWGYETEDGRTLPMTALQVAPVSSAPDAVRVVMTAGER